MKKRTRARELALQFLYQIDQCGFQMLEELDAFLEAEDSDAGARNHARRIVQGYADHAEQIDDEIRSVAKNWELSRMAMVDRNVLRVGTWELVHCDEVPPKVAINEAIELGKRYSTQNSGAFINGILDKIKDRLPERSSPDLEGSN